MPLQHFLLLLRVVKLDLPRSLVDPIEKELHGALADPPLLADFDVVGGGHGEAIRFGRIRDRAKQEPAAAVKMHDRQFAAL